MRISKGLLVSRWEEDGDSITGKEHTGSFRHLGPREKHKLEILHNSHVPLCFLQFLRLPLLYGELWTLGTLGARPGRK